MLVFFLGINSSLFSMAKCATHVPVVLVLTIILLLLSMSCKYSLNDGSSLAYSEKILIMYYSLMKIEGNTIISPNFSWSVSKTLPVNFVHHFSYGVAPTVKSLRMCVFPDIQRMGMNILKYTMHRNLNCAAISGKANNTTRFCMSMLSRILPGILRDSSKNSLLTSRII